MEVISRGRNNTIQTVTMMHLQANALILLTLASAGLLNSVLECQADGDQDTTIEKAKLEWLMNGNQRLGEHMLGKVTPVETVEILKEMHAAMPNDDMSGEWRALRTEVARLIDMARVNEECPGKEAFKQYKLGRQKYVPSFVIPSRWVLLQGYGKYFENKQVEVCVAKISKQLAEDFYRVREKDKRVLEVLMSYLPQLQMNDNWEWDTIPRRAVPDKEQVYKAIYRFLEATAGPLSEKIVRPYRKEKIEDLFTERMQFCSRIEAQMKSGVEDYIGIRYYAGLKDFTTRFDPETLKWIKASKLCMQISDNFETARWRMYEWFKGRIKDDEPKKGQPSVASRIIERLKPKKKASE